MTRPPKTPRETQATKNLRWRQRLLASLLRAAAQLEHALDRLIWGYRRRYGRLGPLQLVTYRSFGTRAELLIRGRLVEAREFRVERAEDRRWTNFRRMLRRFNTREVPDAEVRASLGAAAVRGRTDEEGYFTLALAAPELPASASSWHAAEVEVVDCPVRGWTAERAQAELLIPAPGAEFGVISDIDDTVLQTFVTRRLKMLWVTLVGSVFTRSAFEGTSELYQALRGGASGAAHNPFFYVSKSPWNLYDFLIAFLERNGLPLGPLLLRDIGLHARAPLDFKQEMIDQLLRTYAALPFVLIGDSGERDPDIYLGAAARHPGRVRAIYIRRVGEPAILGEALQRKQQLENTRLSAEAARLGCELTFVSSAEEALAHARGTGLVHSPSRSLAAGSKAPEIASS